MEVALIGSSSIRIKGKTTSFLIDPVIGKAKLDAQGVIFLKKELDDMSFIEGVRVNLKGPGEYEVAGVKITGVKAAQETFYILGLDGMTIVVTTASALKSKEHVQDAHIILVDANEAVESSLLASFNPQVVILYGEHAQEVVKDLGKQGATLSKYVVTKDKLPAEMEVILLQQ